MLVLGEKRTCAARLANPKLWSLLEGVPVAFEKFKAASVNARELERSGLGGAGRGALVVVDEGLLGFLVSA